MLKFNKNFCYVTQHRPTGITIIAVLMIIGGIILLFTGITPLFLGPLISIDSDSSTSELGLLITIGGLVLVALGIASLIVSWGLLKGKGWARIITLIISIIAIIFAIISLASSSDLIHIIPVIVYGIIIYYMFTDKVKIFFSRVKESIT
jgi:membrane protein implicated in regulation of membrane protease activity